jgi:hypothetical protein
MGSDNFDKTITPEKLITSFILVPDTDTFGSICWLNYLFSKEIRFQKVKRLFYLLRHLPEYLIL